MRRSSEQASAIIWAIILMVVLAAIVASFSIIVQRSADRTADASRRVSNNATVQAATTRIILGLQNNLGSEQDYYTLDEADLTRITSLAATGAKVHDPATLAQLPPDLQKTGGIWEHDDPGGTHVLVRVTGEEVPNFIVEEPIQVDATACQSAGLPPSTCTSASISAYWQVFRVVVPDITGNDSPNAAMIIRTWLGDPSIPAWSKASYARIELRPGRFADFQLISDGNLRLGQGAVIDGPVHSNGFADGSFATVHAAPISDPSWVYLDSGVRCEGAASITIRTGVITGPGTSSACDVQGATGQSISFLRAIESIDLISKSALEGRPGTKAFTAVGRRGNEASTEPYMTAWNVTLSGSSMQVRYPDGASFGTIPLSRVNAFTFDEDVRVRGTAAPDVRVTIAARRAASAPASIFIDGDLRKGDDRTSAIGLLAQGDVVIWQTPTAPCAVSHVDAAMVAATGGVTIPSRYTTDEFQMNSPSCGASLELNGSIAGHRPPTLSWSWPSRKAGFTGDRYYRWDEQLRRNPPPMFPLTGIWQPFATRDANTDCLFTPSRQEDPTCR